jgi:hypothetical protein
MPTVDLDRRCLLAGGAALFVAPRLALGAATPVELWKSAECGCCKGWVAHLESNGFAVKVHDEGNTDARARLRMPVRYGSCHTAAIGGYTIEGHVPAREIRRLLAERPKAIGLAAPGMPIGSPGMDGPEYGGRRSPYDILLILNDASAKVYQHYT